MNSNEVRRLVNDLPDLEVPEGLASSIDLRIANAARRAPAKESKRQHGWTILLTGGAGGLGVQLYAMLTGRLGFDLAEPILQGWTQRLFDLKEADASLLVLAAALLIYVAVLFRLRRD